MDTVISLPYAHETDLPPGHDNEVRTPPALVERFLREHTSPGDVVFDPFAGYGTTLAVAERLDRAAYGVEYDPERAAYAADRVEHPERVRHGDVRDLSTSWLPDPGFVYTSPPFMAAADDRDPFQNYAGESSYEEYLAALERVFAGLLPALAPSATVVVDVSNIRHDGEMTTLAWDAADALSTPLDFAGEVVVAWEGAGGRDGRFGYGYDHSYCLRFTAPTDSD